MRPAGYRERNITTGQKNVNVTLDGSGGIKTSPWVVDVDLSAANPNPDFIHWIGNSCRIKIEPEHPEHFDPRLPQKYCPVVKGHFDLGVVTKGTYRYCISVLEDSQPGNDAAVFRIDPDYKVDR